MRLGNNYTGSSFGSLSGDKLGSVRPEQHKDVHVDEGSAQQHIRFASADRLSRTCSQFIGNAMLCCACQSRQVGALSKTGMR